MLRRIVLVALIVLWSASRLRAADGPGRPPLHPVLVELFTSQG